MPTPPVGKDATGAVLKEAPVPPLTEAELSALFARLVGKRVLPVSRFSAMKVGGKALYKYAHRGEAAPEVKREMEVTSWELTSWRAPAMAGSSCSDRRWRKRSSS